MIAIFIKFPEPFAANAKANKLQTQPEILTQEG